MRRRSRVHAARTRRLRRALYFAARTRKSFARRRDVSSRRARQTRRKQVRWMPQEPAARLPGSRVDSSANSKGSTKNAQPSGMRYSMTKLEGVGNGNNQADSSRGRGDVPRSLGVHHITRRCGGKASAQDFCAGFHKLALLRRLESAQEIAFHVEDGYDLVAGHNRDRYLRFHQV
jgi:hypothetical protein